MNKVYILYRYNGWEECRDVVAVFSTKDKASVYRDKMLEAGYYVAEELIIEEEDFDVEEFE